jgi:hypothetical protein
MKKKMIFVGLIGIILIIGLSLAGCDNGNTTDSLDGTRWETSVTAPTGVVYTMVLTFSAPNYSLETVGVNKETGTYTVSGNTITFADGGGSFSGIVNGDELTLAATYTFTRKR